MVNDVKYPKCPYCNEPMEIDWDVSALSGDDDEILADVTFKCASDYEEHVAEYSTQFDIGKEIKKDRKKKK